MKRILGIIAIFSILVTACEWEDDSYNISKTYPAYVEFYQTGSIDKIEDDDTAWVRVDAPITIYSDIDLTFKFEGTATNDEDYFLVSSKKCIIKSQDANGAVVTLKYDKENDFYDVSNLSFVVKKDVEIEKEYVDIILESAVGADGTEVAIGRERGADTLRLNLIDYDILLGNYLSTGIIGGSPYQRNVTITPGETEGSYLVSDVFFGGDAFPWVIYVDESGNVTADPACSEYPTVTATITGTVDKSTQLFELTVENLLGYSYPLTLEKQ